MGVVGDGVWGECVGSVDCDEDGGKRAMVELLAVAAGVMVLRCTFHK
jgi:hypothetical protein